MDSGREEIKGFLLPKVSLWTKLSPPLPTLFFPSWWRSRRSAILFPLTLMAFIASQGSLRIRFLNFMGILSRRIALPVARSFWGTLMFASSFTQRSPMFIWLAILVLIAVEIYVVFLPAFRFFAFIFFIFSFFFSSLISLSVDNIVHFGENLPEQELEKAIGHSNKGDLALVLGTSMKVSPACNIPDRIWKKPGGKMVIVNLQKTPFDRYAALRIFGESDLVLAMLMEELDLPLPEKWGTRKKKKKPFFCTKGEEDQGWTRSAVAFFFFLRLPEKKKKSFFKYIKRIRRKGGWIPLASSSVPKALVRL